MNRSIGDPPIDTRSLTVRRWRKAVKNKDAVIVMSISIARKSWESFQTFEIWSNFQNSSMRSGVVVLWYKPHALRAAKFVVFVRCSPKSTLPSPYGVTVTNDCCNAFFVRRRRRRRRRRCLPNRDWNRLTKYNIRYMNHTYHNNECQSNSPRLFILSECGSHW